MKNRKAVECGLFSFIYSFVHLDDRTDDFHHNAVFSKEWGMMVKLKQSVQVKLVLWYIEFYILNVYRLPLMLWLQVDIFSTLKPDCSV